MPTSQAESSPESLSPAIRELLSIFEGELAKVQFPNVSAKILGDLAAQVSDESERVETLRQQLEAAQSNLAEAQQMLAILDARIGERGNIVHDKWTLVDTDVASTLGWALHTAKIGASRYRHIGAWLGRFQERPVVCAHMNQAS